MAKRTTVKKHKRSLPDGDGKGPKTVTVKKHVRKIKS